MFKQCWITPSIRSANVRRGSFIHSFPADVFIQGAIRIGEIWVQVIPKKNLTSIRISLTALLKYPCGIARDPLVQVADGGIKIDSVHGAPE